MTIDNKSILIVEDNEAELERAVIEAKNFGFQNGMFTKRIVTATTLEEALNEMNKKRFDYVLTDMFFPAGNMETKELISNYLPFYQEYEKNRCPKIEEVGLKNAIKNAAEYYNVSTNQYVSEIFPNFQFVNNDVLNALKSKITLDYKPDSVSFVDQEVLFQLGSVHIKEYWIPVVYKTRRALSKIKSETKTGEELLSHIKDLENNKEEALTRHYANYLEEHEYGYKNKKGHQKLIELYPKIENGIILPAGLEVIKYATKNKIPSHIVTSTNHHDIVLSPLLDNYKQLFSGTEITYKLVDGKKDWKTGLDLLIKF